MQSVGIHCELLAAAPLQKLTNEPILLEEESVTSDAEQTDLDTFFQITQDDIWQQKLGLE